VAEGLVRDAPGLVEDFGEDEHCHVAPDPVALLGDPGQLAEHRVLQGGVAVV